MEKRAFMVFSLLLVLLISQVAMIPRVEAGLICKSRSRTYKGLCLHDHWCAIVCRDEGQSGGNCKPRHKRCFCTRLC